MEKKSAKIIFIILASLAAAFVIGFYIYDVVVVKTPATKNLFRTIAIVALLIISLIRVAAGRGGRRSLTVYEKIYEKELGSAFKNKPFVRKRLLCAIRLYNENDYRKALKNLFPLLKEMQSPHDVVPVLLFIALCYTDAGVPDEAIKVYYDLLKYDPSNSTVHGNLAHLYIVTGDYEMARQHSDKAIECNPNNPAAYHNRANYYFRLGSYDEAIADAKKALEIKNNMTASATLLAIIYALLGDAENKRKYYHIAITSGQNPQAIDNAIARYMSELEHKDELDEEQE